MGYDYTDYDLVVLNKLKDYKTVITVGEDVAYFGGLIKLVYKNTGVSDMTLHDISGIARADCLIIGDGIINSDISSRLKGIEAGTVIALSKKTSLNRCCNAFIKHGYEILNVSRVKVREGEERSDLLFTLKKHLAVINILEKNLTKRYDKVFVLCPRAIKSGGPELLHQLVYHINSYGGRAYIAYVSMDEEELLVHPELESYVYGRICRVRDIEDRAENLLVFPEGWPMRINYAENIKKLFWWLSVDNFISACRTNGIDEEKKAREISAECDILAYQSEYARIYSMAYNDQGKPLIHLGDYLNDSFIDNSKYALDHKKKDIVVYNPKKGIEYTKKLIEEAGDIEFVAIENMTTEQVAELLQTAKVYIDFGNHPGKDRIPREAAISGCIVITGEKGSAKNEIDVAINKEYKIDDSKDESLSDALWLIRDCLSNYYDRIGDFKAYREGILSEKEEFLKDVREIFFE
ncbi:MAG: hypothetical protein K5931_06910 [Lachnospiraceae bacterium]|nr:hypothetical protein [Lachnospiraceae bacterium]